MPRVTLIFTVHEEQGRANSKELFSILRQVRPEVIFLEVPEAAFDDFYRSRTRRNLEADAVFFFIEECPQTTLIPVDLPTPAREFFEDHEQLCMTVRAGSPAYRQLVRVDQYRQRAYGFAYLNSEYCSQHWSDLWAEIHSAIGCIDDSRLSQIQDAWHTTNERREIQMLAKVRRYSAQNRFDRAALLVGAAHRRSLLERLGAETQIEWAVWEANGDV